MTTKQTDQGKRPVFDTELKTMGRMVRLLQGMPADAQARVVAYMQSRYLAGLPKQADLSFNGQVTPGS
jgi:hypothetical protein